MRKVLILGKSAKESSLAQILAKECKVFVAPGNETMKDFAELVVDIDDYDAAKIVEFVLENDISLTIPTDNQSISEELLQMFEQNNLQIFAPPESFINITKDKIAAKKLLYKLHIPTPRFASFDKTSMAHDYVRNNKNTFIIKSNLKEFATICVNTNIAKTAIDDLTLKNETILIEEYINGQTFSIYFISDGYKVLPLGTALNYNFTLEGDGGILTNGIGAVSPFYKLTDAHLEYLTNNVASSIREYFEQQTPLIGIWGVEAILTNEDNLFITNIKHFLSDSDAQGILAQLDINILKLINDCILGTFADIYDNIPTKDIVATSGVLSARNDNEIIEGLNILDENTLISFYGGSKNKYLEFETQKGKVLNITTTAGTISRARKLLYEEIESINFATKTYRKDIGAIMTGSRGLL